jgi:5-dehydro-2-deoxygluconokinase
MTDGLEILTIGRISVDLYSETLGAGWTQTPGFRKALGGSPTNVAVAAARLGRRAAVVTKVGDDPFGVYARAALEAFGVDTRFVGVHPTLKTPLAFAVLDPPEDPPLLFYREPSAPDLEITPEDVDAQLAAEVPILWISASALSQEPSAGTTEGLLAARGRRAHAVLDLDYRPMFWPDEAAASARIGAAVGHATVAVGNREECRIAVGTAEPRDAARRLLDRGVELAIVKLGGDGVLVATRDEEAVVAPARIDVLCGLGAGDAFGGALCHGLLSGWAPVDLARYANAAGAIVASRLLCADAMPSGHEVEELMESHHGPR